MNDKFTIEQIDAVFSGENNYLTCKELREKLTKPSWTPAVGEVYMGKTIGGIWSSYIHADHTKSLSPARPLNSSEVPALKVAIEALSDLVYPFEAKEDCAEQALAKITELTQSNGAE